MGLWSLSMKPTIHLVLLTTPASKNDHVARPRPTKKWQYFGHRFMFRNKHVSWFLFSDIRPRTFVELRGKEKIPFHWTLRWASEGWLCWDLTCDIYMPESKDDLEKSWAWKSHMYISVLISFKPLNLAVPGVEIIQLIGFLSLATKRILTAHCPNGVAPLSL